MTDSHKELVISILKEICSCPDNQLIEVNLNEPLTGGKLGLSNIDLVYVFFELEKRCGIRILPENLDMYGFSTINKIIEVVDHSAEKSPAFINKMEDV